MRRWLWEKTALSQRRGRRLASVPPGKTRISDALGQRGILWEEPVLMLPEDIADRTPARLRMLYDVGYSHQHPHRPHHLHQTGELHRPSPVRTFGRF